jgi:hypothetical protein
MHHRLRTAVAVLAIGMLVPSLARGQAQPSGDTVADPNWEMPRLASGDPNLQGYWTTQTFTPMERPEYLGNKAFYSEEEWAQLQAQLTVAGADPLARSVITRATATRPTSTTTMRCGWRRGCPRASRPGEPR